MADFVDSNGNEYSFTGDYSAVTWNRDGTITHEWGAANDEHLEVYEICPLCDGDDPDCVNCDGSGLVPHDCD